MKKILSVIGIALAFLSGHTQDTNQIIKNSAERLMSENNNLQIGGYGQIDYNQPLHADYKNNGVLDVHRLVMLFGYRFNAKTHFITEIEFEHINEVYIEQAFLNYSITPYLNFRGGLLLVPMGIINEYHEPPAFNGVERPFIDSKIAPTTWREIGAGFEGKLIDASIRYQVYLVNGFKSYDNGPTLNGKDALRKGRQKGAESFFNSPNLSAKLEYFGLPNFNLGISGYFGKTQSTAYDDLDKSNNYAIKSADSSVVGISMVGTDLRYSNNGLQIKGQLYWIQLSNTLAYNSLTRSTDGTLNDLGKKMIGYYAEISYNVFRRAPSINTQLIPFLRYEYYNTHQNTDAEIPVNDAYSNSFIIAGLGWKLAPGAMLKSDIQFNKSKAENKYSKQLNAGIAIMF